MFVFYPLPPMEEGGRGMEEKHKKAALAACMNGTASNYYNSIVCHVSSSNHDTINLATLPQTQGDTEKVQ
jgi:hypothetical protein